MHIYKYSYGLKFILLVMLSWFSGILFAQADSVDVLFHYVPSGNPSIVYLPGEFNGWRISGTEAAMEYNTVSGRWEKTVRLRIGGPNPLPVPAVSIPGAYQYKFNENGSAGGWTHDPLNPRQNPRDNNNSFLYTNDPTIHYLLPNSVSGLVRTRFPGISAYIFPPVGNTVIAATIIVTVDETEYTGLTSYYDVETHRLMFQVPDALSSGTHTLKIRAMSTTGKSSEDSTTFIVQAGFVQWLTQPHSNYIRDTVTLEGVIEDASITTAILSHNEVESVITVTNGMFSEAVTLQEGENDFQVSVNDDGTIRSSTVLTIKLVKNHAPKPVILITSEEGELVFDVEGHDPDGDELEIHWTSDDSLNPEILGIDTEEESFRLSIPSTAGEYYVDLIARDSEDNTGIARAMFTVFAQDSVAAGTVNTNPSWVRDAVVYEIFLPAFTPEGTFRAAMERLPRIRDLGVSVIWLMPVYENGQSIDQFNAGYNITDFYAVHPQLGTMADFDAFLNEAHDLGLRVILDSTPNHVSDVHPWVNDIRLYRDYSIYRPMIENSLLGDARGLGQSVRMMGEYRVYAYYSDWKLANLDYYNRETVSSMMAMYAWWVLEKKIDGYRMDVYWGPQNRYGQSVWWRPFREDIKRVRPDILILGETDGTGVGSEVNYADGGGASDAAYDWNLYGTIRSTLNGGGLDALDERVRNYTPSLRYNHYTGDNTHYFRFLENHDESRIAALYALEHTRAAAALLFTIPGIPMIYAGQEVGERSRRGLISWNRDGGETLVAYYRRLIAIRNTFEAFRSPYIRRITTDRTRVYAYLRPHEDQNAIAAVNFSGEEYAVALSIDTAHLWLSERLLPEKTYYLNDVLNDLSFNVTESSLEGFSVTLPAWGSAVFVLADSMIHLETSMEEDHWNCDAFDLYQNFPNPFNSSTTIAYRLSRNDRIRISVYNLQGRRVRSLMEDWKEAGRHHVVWNGESDRGIPVSSGVYIVRMETDRFVQTRKLLLVR